MGNNVFPGGTTMAHKHPAHRGSSKASNREVASAAPATTAAPDGASSSSPKKEDGSSVPSWQPAVVIGAIVLGLLMLLAKALGLF